MQGVLRKKGGALNREWQERYFSPSKEDPQEIQYFLSDNHAHPQGSFSLVGATVTSMDVKGKKIIEVCFLLYSFCFYRFNLFLDFCCFWTEIPTFR